MPSPGENKPPSIIDSLAELLQLASDWLRQEAGSTMREKVVKPLQTLGLTIASASASGCMLVVGLLFIAVALFMWLGAWLGYPLAFFIVGSVYLIVSGIFLFMKVRLMQK